MRQAADKTQSFLAVALVTHLPRLVLCCDLHCDPCDKLSARVEYSLVCQWLVKHAALHEVFVRCHCCVHGTNFKIKGTCIPWGGVPFGYYRKPLLKLQLHSMHSNDTWLQPCCAGADTKVWWWCSMHFMRSSLDRHCFSVIAFMMSNVVDCSVVVRFRVRIGSKPNQSTFHFAYERVLQTLRKREKAVNSCCIARVLLAFWNGYSTMNIAA